jgi:NADH:ubiquinone oxidoreductase subunit K
MGVVVLSLVVFSVVTALAEFFWILILIGAAAAHAIGAGLRYHTWRKQREAA